MKDEEIWRYLEPHEIMIMGDEFQFMGFDEWNIVKGLAGDRVDSHDIIARRRITQPIKVDIENKSPIIIPKGKWSLSC